MEFLNSLFGQTTLWAVVLFLKYNIVSVCFQSQCFDIKLYSYFSVHLERRKIDTFGFMNRYSPISFAEDMGDNMRDKSFDFSIICSIIDGKYIFQILEGPNCD